MTAIELLSRLRDLGITITADGDRLRVNAARGTLTPELRDALTSHKGQLLELLRTKVTDNGEAPITRVPRDQPNPLSFAQERLWFLDQLTPGGTAYSIPFFLRLEGPLDVDALHRALQEIVVRHEALRTAFPAVHGEPRQVILDDFELPLPIERLDGTREEREATAHRLATEENLRPFDLARGPLVRARLLHVDDQDHVLLLALHHAAIDIWSIGLLRNELSTLYEAFREDRASPLEPLPVQYVDFAAWQRRHLDDAVIAGHLAWWEPRLAGAETLALPTDHPRPAVQSFAGGHHRSTVPGPVLDGLRRLAREEKASVFMVTLAAFQLLLHHYCGQDDIVIGTTVVNRDREEIKSLIGFFSNTLVMRGNFGGNRTFRSLLRETRETALGAYAHQALPFETLVNKLQPVRDLSRNPIFQVFFAQLNTEPIASDAPRGTGGMRLADLTVTPFAHGKTPTHFDLELDVDESATGLVTRYVYSRDLFDAATIERMDRHYQNLLAAIVAAPDQPAGTLPIMEDAERTEVLDAWNATDAPFAADRCIHELFEAQVRRTPQQTAVVFEGESLTYDELNAAANRIAHSLRRHGVGPEVPVAICMERSIEMVVALLGVLKAGGAYVPLDPTYPQKRLAFMLEDSGVSVLLTQASLLQSLPDRRLDVLCLDRDASAIGRARSTNPPRLATAGNLAYVIYTSGSTGRPKGVGVTHRGLVNYLSWCADAYGLASGEVALVHSPITFDLTVTGLLAPLTVGGRVRLVPEAHGVEGLAQAIRAEDAVGLVKITPAHLQLLGGQLDATERRRVRTFVIGGESLTAEHVSAWMDGATRLINEYGPTETVVGACVHDVVADDLARSSIPIGRPLANARIYVLDKRMAPVPIGIPGEIYIGGAGVARGYVNRPALTAERFVPDPFAAEPGARLYRTGDLARHLPDGGLEFLGRRDEQVKVRGYRIELGEIEGVLLEHDAVTQAVAMVREDRPGDRTLVAYVVGADAPSAGAMRSFLKDRLPEYMVPASFVTLDAMPLTPNGKVDRRALPAPGGERQVADAYLAPRGERQEQVAAIWCDVLALEKVGVRDNFFDLGGHSLLVVRVHARLVEELECDLTVTDLFQYPTIEKLSRRLRGEGGSETLARQAVRRFPRRHTTETESVAVIAMVGRFPGANSIDELWKNLRNGVEGIHRFSDDELREIGVPEHLIAHPDYVKARGVIDDIDRFDAWFFGYNPREAELIDPQHRIFLECAWEALETAGYDPERYHGAIGVYAGTKANTYEYIVRTRPDLMAAGGNLPQLTGDSDFLATRVAYKLNLRGPSMNVQTACSTSLVAIHEACRALLDYQCDMALAGGVSLTRPIAGGYIYEEGGIQSPDGHCRVFDARAQGTVAADGAAIVVLKRLDDAIADGDQIHAVVRGTAVNNDGSLKVGFTAPSVDGQAEVISLAHARAGVEPDAIGYVEAHGTGTVLGDPIEVAALKQAFRRATARQGFCALGAIKSNLGHLNHAAGVAGFIKAALSVEHGEIPPSLHFERPNPELGIEQSPFFVNTELRAWTGDGKRPRLSAVSSFGIGGTNAHVILEEAPPLEPAGAARPSQLLVLSARNASGLEAAAQNLAAHLRSNEDQTLADVAYTLQVGRRQFEHRRAVLGRNAAEVVEALDGNAPDRTWTQHAEAREHPVAFLFPGQGAQYVDMARDLYRDEAAFRATVDACVAGLDGELDFDLRKLLYPDAETVADDASERLTRTSVAQPALFVVEYALAQLWRSWGIEPSVMIGHSSGEYVAACVSGVLELDDALRLVAARGRLMEQMPPGTMLSVPLGEDELRERLAGRDGLWLAAVNAPSLCVVSGHADRIEAFSHKLADSGIDTRRLHTSHAFHSGLMQEAVEPFVEIAGEIEFGTPRIPYLSNVTGDWITEADVSDPSYWGRHIRDAVRFADGIGRILTETDHVLLEVGPGQVLGSIARQHPGCGRDRLIVPSLRHPQSDVDDASFLMGALGRLWTGGIEVDWSRFHGPGRRRVPLPTYPFQRERYWIEAGRPQQAATRPSLRDWFYVPGWRHTPPVVADPESAPAAFPVLVFADASPLSKQVVADLRRAGGAVTVVEAGDAFAQMDDRFVISAEQTEDYGRLVTELASADGRPPRVIHLWNATAEEGWLDDAEAARRAELGFYSVLYLARALGEAGGAEPVHMDVVTTGVHEVTGEDVVQPEKALVLGPGRVMGREFSDITCRVIDLAAREIAGGEDALGETLLAEIRSRPDHPEVAYRAGRRYVQMLGRVPLEAVRSDQPARLRAGGTYLITGGLGGIGLEIAKYLAQAVKANLVLTARTPLPERDAWIDHLAAHGEEDDPISRRIRAVIAVEEAGGQVMVAAADTADRTAMQEVVAEATRRFGPINGVVHSAGVPGGGVILLKQREEAARVLRPKVDGSRVLYDIFGGSELDFMVLCSSATSILGNAGQVDYCAANAYQDCFARRFAADTGTFTVAVNWGRWREVGMAVEAAQVSGHRGPLTGASNAEGIEAFRRVLDAGVQPQVAVFEEDMVAALDRTAADEPTDRDGEEAGRDDRADASTATGYARPRLASEYAPPETDLERAIAAIWEQILGIEGIGRHDDFFELGGHSLIATRIVSRLREMIDVDVSLRAALEHKTIATLAASLDAPASSTTLPPIVPIARDSKDKIPLSSAQRRLWFLDQLGASTGYNLGLLLRYDGRLDIDRLRETFAAMTDRHEVLRTSFPDDGGHAYQRIVDAVEIPIRVVDVAHLTSEAGVAEAHRSAGVEFLRPFDLAEGPLLRATVVRMRDGDVLIITVHHIVSDAWSVPLFRREIVDRYDLLSRGIEPDFPPLPVQYADFAAWQNTWFDDAALRSQMDYWTAQLGGELPVLELPTDRPRPPLQTFNGASRRITFTPELFDDIRGFARDRGVTTAMVMLAAFKVLLSRYTGLEDVVVGSPIAGRTRTEIEDLIGFFVNTLVMRTDLSGEPSFDTVVERVKRVALEAYEHQDLPFERLVDQLDPERDLRHNPLFQVAFVMNTVDTAAATDTGFTNLSTDVTVTRTDIELYLSEHPAAMGGMLVYNTDLFDGATIERMLEHYLRLLESALDDPAAPITTLPLLSEAERHRLLVEWNDTAAAYPDDTCVHELFEAQVERTPEAMAVVFEDQTLTYAQLNERANQLAHTLRDMGVGREDLVGLCVERSLDMIVGLLGILKAGGAYVPLDPTYPPERLAFMLADSGVSLLLTQATLLDALPPFDGRRLCLDREAGTLAEESTENPAVVTCPDNLAYAIYTSGSTGRPKGTLLAHRGLVSLSAEQGRAFGAGPGSRVLQFSSLSFDACTFEITMALPKGATLFLGDREELMPGPDLLEFIRANEISIVTLPPTALAALPVEPLPSLRTITVAGEACSSDLVSRWARGRQFFNLYGPTEATIWSTTAELRAGETAHIGRPNGNVQVYVLDAHEQPVPVGVPGELHVGGISVARGYLDRPALTAERFVPDPFRGAAGGRLYRTGDLVRYRADGTIEFLGRIDEQVKLRGYRIELGEIESVLDEHPAVLESVALVREDIKDDRRLVAYVTCDESVELVKPGSDSSAWQDDHVAQWQTLYDESYAANQDPAEAAFNIAGWNSSYTGEPIPPEEMREWVNNTVARIRSTGPERILEMGCGSGLLLLNLVPHCAEYVGADFSQPALDYVARQLERMGDDGAKGRVECRTADNFEGLPRGHFDTVVLNSVVQYFPDAAYLRRVLEGAVAAVRPGGRVFVGDVRSLPLLRAFHASVQLELAPIETTREQLERRVRHEMNQDQELVIDPSFFTALAAEIGGISHVELEPKRGRYDNELSRFRYDVIVHVAGGAANGSMAELDWRTWDDVGLTLSRVRMMLAEEPPATLALAEVPNRRVARDVEIAAMLDDPDAPGRVNTIRSALKARANDAPGVEPDDLRSTAEKLGYDVHVSQTAARSDGSYDVVLARRADNVPAEAIWRAMPISAEAGSGAEVTNRPLRGRFLRELVPQLREHASARLPEYMVPSVFTVMDRFPLTPNGKVDRRALPAPDALRPELAVAYEAPRSEQEETLARIWVQVLGVDRVGAHDNFFELGGDSMLSIQVVALAREAGIGISARDLFQFQTVAELAAAAGAAVVTAEQGVVTGDAPLTPIMSWFFEQDLADAHHFNQAFMIAADTPFDASEIEDVLGQLVTHHDALRLRARRADEGWTMTLVEPGDSIPVDVVDLSVVAPAEQAALIEREAARVQASLDLERGPPVRCAIFRGGAAESGGGDGAGERLLIVIHHLAVDVVSWGVLLDDLARAIKQRRAGQPLNLPAKTTSIREWASRLDEHAQSAEVAADAEYWSDLPWSKAGTFPIDHAHGANTIDSVRSVPVELDEEQTRAVLHEVPGAFNATVEDVLLAALAIACAAEMKSEWTIVDLEGHGREAFAGDLDVSRTVGWFTSIHPVLLQAEPGLGAGAVMRSVKEQLRAVPGNGTAFGLARYLARDAGLSDRMRAVPEASIAFNYLGRLDQMTNRNDEWTVSARDTGPSRSERGVRQHLLEVSGAVMQGRLRMGFGYSSAAHQEATIQRLAERYGAALIELIEASRSGDDRGYTASDLAEVGWNVDDVSDLLSDLEGNL